MSTGIPAQVKAQSDKADELLQNISKEVTAPKVEDKDKPPVETETVESLKTKLTEAEHKFDVLQGKYNAEITPIKEDVALLTRLKGQVKTLSQQLQEANGKLQEQNTFIVELQKQIAKPQDGADDSNPLSALSEEERSYLHDEGFEGKVLEIFGKMVMASHKKAEKPPTKQNDEEAISKAVKNDRVKRFWQEFTDPETGIPDWEAINGSDEFNTWLDNNAKRADLQKAQDNDDYKTAIKIFSDFKKAKKQPEPKPKINPDEHIEPTVTVTRQETDKVSAGKIYTRKDVQDFYKDVAIGKYKGKEKEAAEIDADIIKANAEGRIQG